MNMNSRSIQPISWRITSIAWLVVLSIFLSHACPVFADGLDRHGERLSGHDFRPEKNLNGVNFTGCSLNGANFENCSLKKTIFKDANLDTAFFSNANASDADFSGATGTITVMEGNFTGAIFENKELPGLTLYFNARNILRGANLKKCKITNLGIECDLSGADLRGANLRGARISSSVIFKKAIYDEDTTWPDGFDPVAKGAVLKRE
jgi:uncharacterized protein YjbI with pentapeptide repeats